jgi:hypothetical protein
MSFKSLRSHRGSSQLAHVLPGIAGGLYIFARMCAWSQLHWHVQLLYAAALHQHLWFLCSEMHKLPCSAARQMQYTYILNFVPLAGTGPCDGCGIPRGCRDRVEAQLGLQLAGCVGPCAALLLAQPPPKYLHNKHCTTARLPRAHCNSTPDTLQQ